MSQVLRAWALRCYPSSSGVGPISIRCYSSKSDAETTSPPQSVPIVYRMGRDLADWSCRRLRLRRIISTLDPSRITSADYLDALARASMAVAFPTQNSLVTLLQYVARSDIALAPSIRKPFPAHAHGFLYCNIGPHHRECEPYVSVRLRVTADNSPSSFPSGEDLLAPSGFPWQISLIQLACRDSCAGLAQQLVLENLVTTEQLSRCRSLLTRHKRRSMNPEYTLFGIHSQFLVNFKAPLYLNVVAKTLHSVQVPHKFSEQKPNACHPWTGVLTACIGDLQ
jgi:hypothetical protein